MDPLSDLDGVAWASLHGTYRSAEDVPQQITALRSLDPAVRGDALAGLWGAVIHQGTHWQVSAHVVPFLVRLINDPATPARRDLTTLLRQVGLGARDHRHLPFDPDAAFSRIDARTVTKQQEDMVIERVYYLHEAFAEDWVDIANACAEKWEADAYRATAASVYAYRRWLCDDDPDVASQAAELLAWFTPTEPTVAALLSTHQSDAARASANLAVAHMNVSPTVTLEWMTPLLGHRSLVVRMTASIALAYRLGPDLPDEALNILIDAKTGEALPDFPLGWHERAPRGYVARALQHLGLG